MIEEWWRVCKCTHSMYCIVLNGWAGSIWWWITIHQLNQLSKHKHSILYHSGYRMCNFIGLFSGPLTKFPTEQTIICSLKISMNMNVDWTIYIYMYRIYIEIILIKQWLEIKIGITFRVTINRKIILEWWLNKICELLSYFLTTKCSRRYVQLSG